MQTQLTRGANIRLWIVQGLLAALFLFAGGFKLIAPAAQLAQQSPMFSPAFLKFIGTCEALGAFGLVLPGIFRVQRHLAPLAAAGLTIIMIGAVVSTVLVLPVTMAIMPAIVGLLALYVARGRWPAMRDALRPAAFRIERRTTIAAPASSIFAHINDFHRWSAWSPYEKMDPNARKSYSGAAAGVGASFHYAGRKVGEGRMTIIGTRHNEYVAIRADFIKPMTATNRIEFTLEPSREGISVTWAMSGTNNVFAKAFASIVSIDRLVGKEFESGLATLKLIAELEASHPIARIS
jgi:hypothetical protein